MTALTSRSATLQGSVRDLAAIWLTLTLTLVYLEVPIGNAPLFATALVLQAALGTVVIVRLLEGAQPSLLMLLGPGLILGGALSFVLFQLVGRGVVGLLTATLAGIASAGLLLRSFAPETDQEPRWWVLGQIAGAGALAVAPEFTELLPAAVALFGLGVLARTTRLSRRAVLAVTFVGMCAVFPFVFLRREYWWLTSDELTFFEVISRHLTLEGPFADWGTSNFARYHWLSFGWNGLLDVMGGSPEPLTTLTKVMPAAYTISMISSLALMLKLLHRNLMRFSTILLVWVIAAIGQWDWSSTSTAGVYAVLAAFISLGMFASNSGLLNLRTVVLLSAFLPIIMLTKLPSFFVAVLCIWMAAVIGLAKTSRSVVANRMIYWALLLTALPGNLGGVWLLGRILGRGPGGESNIQLRQMNPDLGQLSQFGPSFAVFTLATSQLWLLMIVVLIIFRSSRQGSVNREIRWLTHSSTMSLLLGLIYAALLDAWSSDFVYFTGPMYFVASLGLLVFGGVDDRHSGATHQSRVLPSAVVLMTLAGLVWMDVRFAEPFWDSVTRTVSGNTDLRIEILRFFTADRLFGASLAAFVIFVIWGLKKRSINLPEALLTSWLLALVLMAFTSLGLQFLTDSRREVSSSEVIEIIGPSDVRDVGTWLRMNTRTSDLIATNYKLSEASFKYEGYPLAAWSHREFLILGFPTPETRATQEKWIQTSRAVKEFVTSGNREGCQTMLNLGARWFVADLEHTSYRDWPKCATIEFSSDRFVILALAPAN